MFLLAWLLIAIKHRCSLPRTFPPLLVFSPTTIFCYSSTRAKGSKEHKAYEVGDFVQRHSFTVVLL
jgi:hypothetical protein